jgi:diphosphomevalonate decarboxylase
LYTETTVTWSPELKADQLTLNGKPQTGAPLTRVATHLNVLRQRLPVTSYADVVSVNNFPIGAGIASSAAAFAALTVAAVGASGVQMSEHELSTLARIGSGSAARSVPSGFVEWRTGETHKESYAESFAPPDYWDIIDLVAVVSREHKAVVSEAGHHSATTSDLQAARVAGAGERFRVCKQAILDRDFANFAEVVERDSNLMHAVMMTSRPPLFYWLPLSLTVMDAVRRWRQDGLQVCYTLDAGPNVHCICVRSDAEQVSTRLRALSDVLEVLNASPGGGAQLITG